MRFQNYLSSLVIALFALSGTCFALEAETSLRFASGFEQAKVWSRQHVYNDRDQSDLGSLYCGCRWEWVGRSGGRVDLESCGYTVRAQPHRAERTEWEHIVPAWTIGHQRQCWQEGGRRNCSGTDPVFRRGYVDLHNLSVSVGEFNADRSNFEFSVLPHAEYQHGSCASKVDFRARRAEPRDEVKGMVARVYFYMSDGYGLRISRQKQQLLMAWDRMHPPTDWELERDRRIAAVQGNNNPYVTGTKTWKLDQPLSRFMLTGFEPAQSADTQNTVESITPPTGELMAPIIGNRNTKVYHLPEGCPSYNRVSAGNRVEFKTEDEAQAAGFSKAGNCR